MTAAPAAAQGVLRPSPFPVRRGRFAALHRQGAHWRLVIIDHGAKSEVLEARTIDRGDTQAVRAALESRGVTSLVRLLPGSSAVCRLIGYPDGPGSEIDAALQLIAEAELPASVPAHRRGCGPVDMPAEPGRRAALLVGWTGEPDDPPIGGPQETWTSEPVALEALMRGLAVGTAIYGDAVAGSISLACKGPSRGVIRSLRESADSPAAWDLLIAERSAQAMRAAGLDLQSTTSLQAGPAQQLRFDTDTQALLLRNLGGVRREPTWLAQYALAIGAALASAESSSTLCALRAAAPRPSRGRLGALAAWWRAPAHAWILIATGLALALLGPLAIAATRHAILSARSGGMTQQIEAEQALTLRTAFAQELDQRRWPMTKLLADLAGALPLGVKVESVRVEVGQRFVVRGEADTLDLVNQVQARLNDSRVFDQASIDRTEAAPKEQSGVRFDISARVVAPAAAPKGLEDFASSTLAQRLYGERSWSAPADAAAPAADSARASARPRRADAEGAATGDAPRATAAPRERGGAASARTPEVPPPITDEQIAALDAAAAMKEWTTRQRASKQAGLDQPTRDRLKAEADKAKARMQSARTGAGEGGAK